MRWLLLLGAPRRFIAFLLFSGFAAAQQIDTPQFDVTKCVRAGDLAEVAGYARNMTGTFWHAVVFKITFNFVGTDGSTVERTRLVGGMVLLNDGERMRWIGSAGQTRIIGGMDLKDGAEEFVGEV